MSRTAALVALALVLAAVTSPATAPADVVLFDAKAFADAQESGRSIVVAVHAPW